MAELRRPRSPFVLVTSLAAAVISASGFTDLLSDSVNVSRPWTWWWIVFTAALAIFPLLWPGRLPLAVPLVGCYAFAVVTTSQVAASDDAVKMINNLVLYPMLSCYLGWFYRRIVARVTVAVMFVLSGAVLLAGSHHAVLTTWSNLALASFFCLEAALHLRRKLDDRIETDELTGAYNRAGFLRRIHSELARSIRTGSALSIILIDLDGFKSINDKFGHLQGDRVLTDLVECLRGGVRRTDVVCRLGGDEFLIIAPGMGIVGADEMATRLRRASTARWTYGLAQAGRGDNERDLLRRADADLYRHKARRDGGRIRPAPDPSRPGSGRGA